MSNEPTKPKLEANETDPNQITGRPTQSNGIRQAAMEKNPADSTRKVHPDSVPLAGPPQPSRGDTVMPKAEPTHPEIDHDSARENPTV
jgi:hypothetical protein